MKVISRAPTRISLFGGSTDLDPYMSNHGGVCINMAINIRQKIEMITDDSAGKETKFEYPDRAKKSFYTAFLNRLKFYPNKLISTFDNSIESGLGSSASAAVAMIGAIKKVKGEEIDLSELAELAWQIEVDDIGLFGGKQDQYAAAYGGVNVIEFDRFSTSVTATPKRFIEPTFKHMVLFYIGRRKEAKIQEGLKNPSDEQVKHLHEIKNIATQAIQPLGDGNIQEVSRLLNLSWESKKKSNKGVANNRIDEIYSFALKDDATAGKLCGSGGGGHMLFLVDPKDRQKFIEKMEKKFNIKHVDFSIDWTGLDVRIFK